MTSEAAPVGLSRSEAILAVADVVATVRNYREKLGFTREWLWGDPPTFGGVRWGKVGVMFCLQPALAACIEGHQHSFMVEGIERLYERHRQNGARIISPLEPKPWGLREYTVRDLNGYHLRFGEPTVPPPSSTRKPLPAHVRLVERLPSIEEYTKLTQAVGWTQVTNFEVAPAALRASLYSVVAEDGTGAVGMARVAGDGASGFYIQDVMVLPPYQRQGVGSALMDAVMGHLERAAPHLAFIGLFTGRNLDAFYSRWGFEGPDIGLHGMSIKKW
jgi:GNAT superfamily N-acetyltransferase